MVIAHAAAARFVRDRFGADPTSLQPLDRGGWSVPYAFRAGSRQLVIRFSEVEEDFAKDERAAAYGSSALPVPPVLERGTALGLFFAVTERATGEYLERIGPADLRTLLPRLFALLDAMRKVDVSEMRGYGSWGRDGEAHHHSWHDALVAIGTDRPTLRIYGWSTKLGQWPAAEAAFRDALRALERVAGRHRVDRHLIHSDLLNRNVLVHEGAITAVLDWGSSLYGDFLFDLAWLWFWSPWSPGWEAIDWRVEAARHHAATGFDVPGFEDRLRACALYIGLDGMTYQAWKELRHDLEATAERTIEILRS